MTTKSTKTRVLAVLAAAPLAVLFAPALASAMPADSSPSLPMGTSTRGERPVLHVADVTSMGSARLDALNQAYTDCLIEAGAPTVDADSEARAVPASNISQESGLIVAWPPPASARTACADVNPVFPPALEAATNPTFAAQAQEYVACLRSNGEFVRLLNDENLDWTYRAGHDVPDDIADIEDSCLLGTFGSD